MSTEGIDSSADELPLRQASLYLRHAREEKLLRLIVHDTLSDVLLVKYVSRKWDKVEKVAVEVPRLQALAMRKAGKLVQHEECVRPEFLSWSDGQLKERSGKAPAEAEKWLRHRDESYELT